MIEKPINSIFHRFFVFHLRVRWHIHIGCRWLVHAIWCLLQAHYSMDRDCRKMKWMLRFADEIVLRVFWHASLIIPTKPMSRMPAVFLVRICLLDTNSALQTAGWKDVTHTQPYRNKNGKFPKQCILTMGECKANNNTK